MIDRLGAGANRHLRGAGRRSATVWSRRHCLAVLLSGVKLAASGSAGLYLAPKAFAKVSPDGYTLLMATSSTHSIAPVLNSKIPYDAFKDFAAVALVAEAPSVLVVGASSSAPDARALIGMLKANPGKFNFGSSGIGTYPHLAAEMFKWRAGGLFAVHIPYRGTGARGQRRQALRFVTRRSKLHRVGYWRDGHQQLVRRVCAIRHTRGDCRPAESGIWPGDQKP